LFNIKVNILNGGLLLNREPTVLRKIYLLYSMTYIVNHRMTKRLQSLKKVEKKKVHFSCNIIFKKTLKNDPLFKVKEFLNSIDKTPLILAACGLNANVTKLLLEKGKAKTDSVMRETKKTALHIACEEGKVGKIFTIYLFIN